MLERIELGAVSLERVELTDGDTSPLADVEYVGDVEKDSLAEFDVVETEFQARARRESNRRERATDSEYWVCLCFQSRNQVEQFLRSCGQDSNSKYVNGVALAASVGKPVDPEDLLPAAKIDKSWNKFVKGE